MKLLQGDCFEVMQGLEDNSIDLVLTDPPYGLKFMGKKWDCDVPSVEIWSEALRVLKPGGHLLAFAGTRTQHRMACRIEDAGFEIRDMLAWVYGSGFPKSLDVSKAIDKAAGIWRGKAGAVATPNGSMGGPNYERTDKGAPATDAAREWDGWGTALKPALEPITMARKPLVGTVAANVLEYGTGALNIDACRVGTDDIASLQKNWDRVQRKNQGIASTGLKPIDLSSRAPSGRWPANLIHDGSDEATAPLAAAARFFYCAKASKRERDAGCEGMDLVNCGSMEDDNYPIKTGSGNLRDTKRRNHHPTVKPIALMEYLVKLASSEGQTILDPFMGSGTTGIACQNLDRRFIGIEMNEEHFEIAKNRINNAVVETLF